MAKYLFTGLIFIQTIFVKAQIKNDTLRLFYAINKEQAESHSKKLDSLASAWIGKSVRVKIYGYADFLHSDSYNITLSQKRADLVKSYLVKAASSAQVNIVACKGFGEKNSKDNKSPEGEAFQRRVDVIGEYPPVAKIEEVKPETTAKETTAKKRTIEDLSKGESLSVEGLNFIPGRHFITKASVPILQKLLETLQKHETLKIEIQGHICCIDGPGDGYDYDTYDRKLSENRAKMVYDYLISKGISEDRLSYKGFGHSRPKFPDEKTPEEEQANRRVEILILEK